MRLLREWVRIILEGYVADQQELFSSYPEQQDEIKRMKPKMISWFIKRFGDNPTIQEVHPFGDCIPTIQKYDQKAVGLVQKYNTNEYFRSLVDRRFPEKTWSSLADYINMTVDQMEEIIGLSERKKPRFEIEGNEPDRSDYIGKFGPWNLWMPTTRENSVKIVGYDPETLVSNADWCTTTLSDLNLFYNYTANGTTLFYIIKDNPDPKDEYSRLSIGFKNGKPALSGEDDSVSVDRFNHGLTKRQLKSILGRYYTPLMKIAQEKADEVSHEHPAKKKIRKVAENLKEYENFIAGLRQAEVATLSQLIAREKSISAEVAEKLSNHSDFNTRKFVAGNPSTPVHVLEKLSNDEKESVRKGVASNTSTPVHILKKLSEDPGMNDDFFTNVKVSIIQNPNVPVEIFEKLINDPEMIKFYSTFAERSYTPVRVLEKLSNDEKERIRWKVAGNPSTPAHVIEKLANDDDDLVRSAAKRALTRKKKQGQLAELRKLIQGLI